MVQLPVGGWPARKSCPQTPDTMRRMKLELHLLRGARMDGVAHVRWAVSIKLGTQQGDITFDMEPADRLTLGEYIQHHPLNYISPDLLH